MYLTLAWRNLWRNKRRTLITAASIFLAVLLAIFMRSLQEGSYSRMIENVVSYYTGYIQIHQAGYWDDQSLDNSLEDNAETLTRILNVPGVESSAPRLESFALIASEEETKGCSVNGIDPEAEDELTGLAGRVIAGSYLEADDEEALVGSELARQLGLGVGDTLVLLGQGYHGSFAAGKYAIKGLVKFGSPDLNKILVYLPLKAAQALYGAEGRVTSYAVNIRDPQATHSVSKKLKAILGEDYEVLEWGELMPELVQSIEADRGGGILMMGVLYLIISFGIFGTVLMMIKERQFEFGILISIGMGRLKLSWTLFLETLMFGMLGVLAGIVSAVPLVLYFLAYPITFTGEMAEMYADYGMEPVLPTLFDPMIFLSQALIIAAVILLIFIHPLYAIFRIKPIEAMHNI